MNSSKQLIYAHATVALVAILSVVYMVNNPPVRADGDTEQVYRIEKICGADACYIYDDVERGKPTHILQKTSDSVWQYAGEAVTSGTAIKISE